MTQDKKINLYHSHLWLIALGQVMPVTFRKLQIIKRASNQLFSIAAKRWHWERFIQYTVCRSYGHYEIKRSQRHLLAAINQRFGNPYKPQLGCVFSLLPKNDLLSHVNSGLYHIIHREYTGSKSKETFYLSYDLKYTKFDRVWFRDLSTNNKFCVEISLERKFCNVLKRRKKLK